MRKKIFTISILATILFVVYYLTSAGKTPYDYFTRLGNAFIQGKYYLEEKPSWLSELVPSENGRYFVVYPPMPAIISVPFLLIFGDNFQQQILAHIVGIFYVLATILLTYKTTKNKQLSIFSGLLIGVGSIIWYMASTGSSWYLGQITAAFFLTMALNESFGKKRLLLTGLFVGGAYLSRVHTILAAPLIFYLLIKNKVDFEHKKIFKIKNIRKIITNFAIFLIPMLVFLFFNFIYNYLRYGVFWDAGYFLIPGTLKEPWFAKGIMHPSYIIEDIKIAFLKGPKIISEFPYIIPSWAGLAIWITTPAFIFSLFASLKSQINRIMWYTIIAIFLVVGMHGGTGFAQFGWRFGVDFYPFLTFLTMQGINNNKTFEKIKWILFFIGFIVNLWGVLWINKFGWVQF